MQTKIVNLLGGPGCFKSGAAAFIFYMLKKLGKNVELVTEYAKDLTYMEDWRKLRNQLHILDEQYHRQTIALGKVEYIITDSPLLLTLIYNKEGPTVNKLALEKFNEFNNVNFFLVRSKNYSKLGRTQSLSEAIEIDNKIYGILAEHDIPFRIVKSEEEILPWLMP